MAFYIDSKLSIKQYYSSPPTNSVEQMWITAVINRQKIAVGVIYRPPSSNVAQSINEVNEVLDRVCVEFNSVIVLGDINVNLMSSNTPDVRQFSRMFSSFDLCQLIEKPTRVTATTATLLDVICVSRDLSVLGVDVVDIGGITDHMLTKCEIEIGEESEINTDITYNRNFKNFDINSFAIDALYYTQWNSIYEFEDINDKTHFLNNCINDLFNCHAPIYVNNRKRKYKPYITYNIRQMIKIRNKAYQKYSQCKTDASRAYYVTLRNYVNDAIKREKVAYMHFVLQKNKKHPQNMWNELRKWGLNTKAANKGTLPPDLSKPEEINNYFLNVVGITDISTDLLAFYKNNVLNELNTFSFSEIQEEDIGKALKSIKSNAMGIDQINLKMLTIVMPYCTDVVKHIFNESVKQGIFPDIWKTANVIPIPKVNSPICFNDLRPISILPTIAKVFEKIISTQICEYLETKNILPPEQSGFRKKHGTNTALLKVLNDVSSAWDRGNCTVMILLDQSKAFDLVNHSLLVAKFQYIGFDEVALSWVKNYLHSRAQRVVINKNNAFSTTQNINTGVPQGSILGPILFAIFIFDLPRVLSESLIHLYADDIQLYFPISINNTISSFHWLNSDLQKLIKYIENHGLKINPKKTVALCIGPGRARSSIEREHVILVNREIIPWASSARNLGVILDTNLSFSEHVDNVFRSAFCKLRSLYCFKNSLTKETKLKLIESLIYPHIEYCSSVFYYFLPKYNMMKLQRIQNACMRFACWIPRREHITPHLFQLKKMNIECRVNYLLLVFLHKLVNDKCPSYLYNMLVRRSHVHDVDIRVDTFCIPYHKTSKFEGCFTYIAPNLLNKLIDSLTLPHLAFKRRAFSFCLNE